MESITQNEKVLYIGIDVHQGFSMKKGSEL